MSEHTPGPWVAADYGPDRIGPAQVVASLGVDRRGRHWVVATAAGNACSTVADGELPANALLIAAAPDLLEACKMFAEWLRREDEGPRYPTGVVRDTEAGNAIWRAWYYGNIELCDRAQVLARAATAKAEGRTEEDHDG